MAEYWPGIRGIMSHWGAAWLMAATLAGAGSGPAAAAVTAPAPAPAIAFVSASPVLTQTGPNSWTTTVAVSDSAGCLGTQTYTLVTTSPDRRISATVAPPGPQPKKSACHTPAVTSITLTFHPQPSLSPIPTTAALALALPGTAAPATVTLTVQRDVPGLDYLWIPVITGLAMAGAFVILAGMIGVPYRSKRGERDTATLFAGKFWTTPVYATAAWTFSGSWATNITALGTTIATILTATGALSAVFRGVELGRFALMNVICGGIVVISPLFFGVLNVMCSRRHFSFSPDSQITLNKRPARIRTPAGASIVASGGATFGAERIKPGGTIPVPPGSKLKVAHGRMALTGGPDVAVGPGCQLTLSRPTAIADRDLVSPTSPKGPPRSASSPAGSDFGERMAATAAAGEAPEIEVERTTVTDPPFRVVEEFVRFTGGTQSAEDDSEKTIIPAYGAKITVLGTADVWLPDCSEVITAGDKLTKKPLGEDTLLTIPAGANVMVADMRSLIPAGALTIFGIGIGIGLIAVLLGLFSDADLAGRIATLVAAVFLAIGAVIYAATANRSLAEPGPGSSLNAGSTTSFTL